MFRIQVSRFLCTTPNTVIRCHLSLALLLVATLLMVAPALSVARQETRTIELTSGITAEVLAEMEIPADALPAGETAAMLARFTWKANTVDGVPAGTFEKGVLVDVLMEGSYAMRSGGSLLVARHGADGPPEEIAAEAEVVLDTGDAVMYLENDAYWEFRNAEPTVPGMALEALIISTDPPALPVESVVDPEHVDDDPSLHLDVLGRAEPAAWSDGAPGPLRLTIWQAELAPGATIPTPAAGIVQIVAPAGEASPELTTSADGAVTNGGDDAISVVGLTVTE